MELVPEVLGVRWQLPPGAGLGTAVAEIIGVEAVGIWLRLADDLLRTQDDRLELAADGLARSLDNALSRTHPRLIRLAWQSPFILRAPGAGRDRVAEAMDQRIEELREWVLPLALGTSPIAYQRLREVTGWSQPEFSAAPVSRPTEEPLSRDAVRGATSQTAAIIFRLWAMGSLESRPADDQIVEASKAYSFA